MYLTINWANLLELSLPNCNMDADRVSLLSEGIAINNSIRVANFSSNRIGSAGATAVARALRMNSSIIKLDLSSNRMGDEGASQIAGVMSPYYLDAKSSERRSQMANRKNTRRREKQLLSVAVAKASDGKSNGFMLGDGEEIDAEQPVEHETEVQAKSRNTSIQCLILSGNNIGNIGAHGFAEVMRTHPSLTSLDLRNTTTHT